MCNPSHSRAGRQLDCYAVHWLQAEPLAIRFHLGKVDCIDLLKVCAYPVTACQEKK